jgi:hypothetical protein
MASVELPGTPGPLSVAWTPIDFGGKLKGPLGGAAQRVNRLGNRWRVDVAMPPMSIALARQWSNALTRANRMGAIWAIRQVGTATASAGTPLVAGADQLGDTLAADGFNPGYVFRTGQFFSIVLTRRYLHQLSATGRIDATGEASLAVEPPLRTAPDDNAVLEFAVPKIEGLLVQAPAWSVDPDRLARGFGFAIEEAR